MASFFYCSCLSSAQLDRWQAPKQQPIIDQPPVEQIAYRRDIKDNGYKSVFTNLWLVHQGNRSWIKGLGKNPLMAVPFVRGHRTVSPWTPRNTCVYTRHPTQCHATCGVLTRLPAKLAKKQNAC